MSDKPVWVCDTCGKEVAKAGSLFVNYPEMDAYEASVRLWELMSVDADGFTDARKLSAYPARARWRVEHFDCDEQTLACWWIDVDRIKTWQDVARLSAHLFGKRWFQSTDWAGLLARAGCHGPSTQEMRRKFREVSKKVRFEVLQRGGFRCHYCGGKEQLQLDHVVPLAKGGTNAIDNLVPACLDCNYGKRDRLLSAHPEATA